MVSRRSRLEGQPAQKRHVVGGVASTDAAFVLSKGHVQDPVQTVLNTPVAAHGPRIRRQTGDVVESFRDGLFTLSPLVPAQDQAVQVGSGLVGVHIPEVSSVPCAQQRRVSMWPWFLFTVLWQS